MDDEKVQRLAQVLYDNLETRTREHDGERYTTLTDDAPEWCKEVVYAAHGDFMPDDWRYNAIQNAAEELASGSDPDDAHEFADGNVDTYNGARLTWLSSNLNRPGYCDQAVEDGLLSESADLMTRVGVGQYVESEEVWNLLATALDEVDDDETCKHCGESIVFEEDADGNWKWMTEDTISDDEPATHCDALEGLLPHEPSDAYGRAVTS